MVRPIVHDVSKATCTCGKTAKVQISGGSFLLKGSNWPGKEIRDSNRAKKILNDGPGVLKDPQKYQPIIDDAMGT